MGLEREYDQMSDEIKRLRDSPIENRSKIDLHLTLTVEEASWISRRIYEEIDRGIFSARFDVRCSEHSVDFGMVLLLLVTGTAVTTSVTVITKRTLNHLFDDLEDYLDRKKRHRKQKKKGIRILVLVLVLSQRYQSEVHQSSLELHNHLD